jgi:hypothetical protein
MKMTKYHPAQLFFLNCFDPEEEGATVSRNVGKYLAIDKA